MNHTAALLEIAPDADDPTIAALIAEALLESERLPYCFSIDHNIGAPKYEACPLDYDFAWGKTVGIDTSDRERAKQWLIKAMLRKYTVTLASGRMGFPPGIRFHAPHGSPHSISRAKMRAQFHQRPKPENNDDDIPF
jgi:hypothetical protein